MIGTPSGSATHEEEAFASLGVSWSEEASGSAEVPSPATSAQEIEATRRDSLADEEARRIRVVL